MPLAVRSYLTTGVAVVGASAILAASTVAPAPAPAVAIPNPSVQVRYQAVQLAANVEDSVNALVYAATKVGVSIAELTAPLVAPILGVSTQQAEYFQAMAFVGFAGPLISGAGAVGTALQNILKSKSLAELLVNTIAAPGTVINGAVNGGSGPNLQSLLAILPTTVVLPFPPGSAPVIGVFAPGFINNPGFIYDPSASGVGSLLGGTSLNPTVTLLPPSVTTLLQSVVTTLFGGGLPTGLSASASTFKAADAATLGAAEDKGAGLGKADGLGLLPTTQRPLVKLNDLKADPITQNSITQKKKDNGAASAASGKHGPGSGKTPVHDPVKRVLAGKGAAGGTDGGTDNK
jgi:hypothetical protein